MRSLHASLASVTLSTILQAFVILVWLIYNERLQDVKFFHFIYLKGLKLAKETLEEPFITLLNSEFLCVPQKNSVLIPKLISYSSEAALTPDNLNG